MTNTCHSGFKNKKILSTYKPDSVSRMNRDAYHLSTIAVTDNLYLPTPRDQASNSVGQAPSRCTWHFNSQGLSPSLIA
jgi:hypothetical protein